MPATGGAKDVLESESDEEELEYELQEDYEHDDVSTDWTVGLNMDSLNDSPVSMPTSTRQ